MATLNCQRNADPIGEKITNARPETWHRGDCPSDVVHINCLFLNAYFMCVITDVANS